VTLSWSFILQLLFFYSVQVFIRYKHTKTVTLKPFLSFCVGRNRLYNMAFSSLGCCFPLRTPPDRPFGNPSGSDPDCTRRRGEQSSA